RRRITADELQADKLRVSELQTVNLPVQERSDYYLALEKASVRLQIRVSAIVQMLAFDPVTSQPHLLGAVRYFQERAGEITAADLAVPPEAVADGQAAVRLVRARASEWQIDPARVGFIGFSAGAMTAVAVTIESPPDARPDFVIAVYPAMLPVNVPVDAPPMFLVLASDDPLFGGQGYGLVESWKAAGSPVEFHLFERGGHGFGMRRQDLTSDRWPRVLQEWMHMHGWAPPSDVTVAP
ncbi:MAG: alpha/beta hydrolase fold domain-containing protein, partial [Tardiphaga sp.]|nr:alpha/beta hydrolase fold domain-containing protein [Tardiphaga sp.]